MTTHRSSGIEASPAQKELIRSLLCEVLACLRAQYLSYQTSHWQVVGQSFYGDHLLFQRLYESVQDQIDQLAEKLVGYLGRESVDLSVQIADMAEFVSSWTLIDCHHKRGLQSESDLQLVLKQAYEGIKESGAMTLGLDDWIMATANAHEENEYLLQQALTPVPGRLASGFKVGDIVTPVSRFYAKARGTTSKSMLFPGDHKFEVVSPVNQWGMVRVVDNHPSMPFTYDLSANMLKKVAADKTAMRQSEIEDELMKMLIGDTRVFKGPASKAYNYWSEYFGVGPKQIEQALASLVQQGRLEKTRRGWERVQKLAADDSFFYDNPEKKEVLEFAETGAISNSPEVAAAAAADGELDVSEAEAVAKADEAPPTPTEIKDEAGGSAVSTLNRFVVKTEDPAVEPAVEMNRDRMAAWLDQVMEG